MTDHPLTALESLRRPKLLIRAARFGLDDYRRERDLRRLMRTAVTPAPRHALAWLIEEEAGLEASRRAGAAAYAPARHVEILIALMAEARMLPHAERAA